MAFKATVDYVQLKVIIDTDSLEPISVFQNLKSVVTFTYLQNTLQYVNLSAVNVLLDADSKNLYFLAGTPNAESFGFTDTNTIDVGKVLADVPFITENHSITLEKAESDTLSLTENAAIAVIYIRDYSDSYGFNDAIDTIDTSLGKTDTTTITEDLAKAFSTAFDDSSTLTEDSTLQSELVKTDSVSFADANSYSFLTARTDSLALSESSVLAPALFKTDTATLAEVAVLSPALVKIDEVTMGESFARVVAFVRAFTDAVALDDLASVEDPLQTDVDLNKANIATLSEESSFAFEKPALTESVAIGDAPAIAVSTPFSETLSLSENSVFVTGLGKTDSVSMGDVSSFSFSTSATDTTTVTEALVLGIALPFADTATLSDAPIVSTGLTKTDTALLSEILAHSFSKSLTDSATITESISIDFVPGVQGSILNTVALNTSVLN
jgi:trimeric autotransporter adhesin